MTVCLGVLGLLRTMLTVALWFSRVFLLTAINVVRYLLEVAAAIFLVCVVVQTFLAGPRTITSSNLCNPKFCAEVLGHVSSLWVTVVWFGLSQIVDRAWRCLARRVDFRWTCYR